MINMEKYPSCYKGIIYAHQIINEEIVACEYIKGACRRFFDDLEKVESDSDYEFYFDYDKAERFLRLAQRFKHVKGVWKTPNLVLEPWQCFGFMQIYGWYSKLTQNRRFRTVHWEVARGNGKSANASQVGLYHLSLENPVGNEIYSAATGRDQARIVLDSARAMAKANDSFLKKTGTRVLANKILHEKSNSFFKALSADSNTLDGLQPACAIIDELHAHKNRKVFDVIDSAMSKRRDSLLFVITTAGFDTSGIGYSQSVYAKKVALGEVKDERFFSFVFTLDKDDDVFDPNVWQKANPNWGVSVDPVNFEAKALKAQASPSDKDNFIVKHLNLWINSANPFFNIKRWDNCADNTLIMDRFKGLPMWVGIDLASKIDLTSFAYIFKEDQTYHIFTDNFIPEARVEERVNDSYAGWVEDKYLIATKGEAINYPFLQEFLLERFRGHKVIGVHYDPWSASEFAQRLSAKGIDMVEFRMSTGNLSEPMKTLGAKILEEKVKHIGSPLMSWAIGNVVAKIDANENVFPRKENEKLKIDTAIAIIMGIAGHIQEELKESVYETRGVIVI